VIVPVATIYILSKVGEQSSEALTEMLEKNLEDHFPKNWLNVGLGSYVVASTAPTLTRDISDLAGITNGQVGSYIVTRADSYYGWASNDIWEWMAAHRSES